MALRLVPALVLFLLLCPAVAAEPDVPAIRERAEKSMAAQRASEVKPSDQEFAREVTETLAALLPADPGLAVRYFLKCREQVQADRKAGTPSSPAGQAQDPATNHPVSALGAALAGALVRVEPAIPNGDKRLPRVIGAVAEMLIAERGCGVELCYEINARLSELMIKAGKSGEKESVFTVQRLLEALGTEVKPSGIPAIMPAVRAMTWAADMKSDNVAQDWLAKQVKEEGAHRELAKCLLATARISHQEQLRQSRTGIMARRVLPEEQEWMLQLLEHKDTPAALLAGDAGEIVRDWPAAESPLRCAAAMVLAAAWNTGAPVTDKTADWIIGSLMALNAGGVPPPQGAAWAATALADAWVKRMENAQTKLYGWPQSDRDGSRGANLLRLMANAGNHDAVRAILLIMQTVGAKDESLAVLIGCFDELQRMRCHIEALQLLTDLTEAQLKAEKVSADRRVHIANKLAQVPIQIAAARGGLGAAEKTTAQLLNARTSDPVAWTGAAWAWHNWGSEFREDGNHAEALRRFCMGLIFAHAANHFAAETHGKYQPPSESSCRTELTALKIPPVRVKVFRTEKSVREMLAEFPDGWKSLSKPVLGRILDGTGDP